MVLKPGVLRAAAHALFVALITLSGVARSQGEPGPPDARDAVVDACLASFDASQALRRERKLMAAKTHLVACSQQSCPSVVVVKCQQWLEEVKESIPTVVIAARDEGKDVFDVKAFVDDTLAHESLTGVALELDPGPRKIAVDRDGWRQERTLLIRQGEKNRVIEFDFSPKRPLPKPLVLPAPVAPLEPSGPGFNMPLLSWIGFGLGLAGVIVGSITGVIAINEGAKLQEQCPDGRCQESTGGDFGPGETIAHVSTVSFAVAGAGIALGVIGLIVGEPEESCPVSSWGLSGRF